MQKYAKWIIKNYDANKNGELDFAEAKKLWNDVVSYDYSGELVSQVNDAQNWVNQSDHNRDGKLSIEEIASALQSQFNVTSFASSYRADPVEQKLQDLADWIMANYDRNRDQTLDNAEARRLFDDIRTYDYSGINATEVYDVKSWIASFDSNRDGKITVGELLRAIKSETGVSFASTYNYTRVDPLEQKLQQVGEWIMANYDRNRDQTLDNAEVRRLFDDIRTYDYSGINATEVYNVKSWIASFDSNRDGKITLGELVNAVKSETGVMSFQAHIDTKAPAYPPEYYYNYTNATNATNTT
jgi:Ca2+-binding EF-hand superfamily protein